MRAPDVPGVLDCVNGALSCQHSSADRPWAAVTVVMFKYDGARGVPDRDKGDAMAQGGRKSKLSGDSNEQVGAGDRKEQDILRQSLFATKFAGRECQDPTLGD